MKKLGLILTVISIFFACHEDAYICKDPRQIDLNAICDSNYMPVCGCDGITYLNSCQAELKAGLIDWTDGACIQECQYNDTVLVFATGSPCVLLQNSTSDLYELIEGPRNFTWELGEYYLINYIASDLEATCMIGTAIQVECALLYNQNCKAIVPIQGEDLNLPSDSIQIDEINLAENCLNINYSFLGGCSDHRIDLYHLIDSSSDEVTRLQIRYDNGEGPCTDSLSKLSSFDLSSLQIDNQNTINIQIDCNGDDDFVENINYIY